VLFVACLDITELINARKMEHTKIINFHINNLLNYPPKFHGNKISFLTLDTVLV